MNSCAMRRSRLRRRAHRSLCLCHRNRRSSPISVTQTGVKGACRSGSTRSVRVMANKVTATEFDAGADLPDWRVLLGRIEASFRAGSFEAAAEFVGRIAAAAEATDHHPDVDLRYPDRVNVALVTHAANVLTDSDVSLARTISEIAAAAGVRSEPTVTSRVEIAIDALDIDAVRPFWQAVLGYVEEPPRTPGGQIHAVVDPNRIGPAFWFQQMDEPTQATQPHPPRRHGSARRCRGADSCRARGWRDARECQARQSVLDPRRSRGQRGVRVHVAGPRPTSPRRHPVCGAPPCRRATVSPNSRNGVGDDVGDRADRVDPAGDLTRQRDRGVHVAVEVERPRVAELAEHVVLGVHELLRPLRAQRPQRR